MPARKGIDPKTLVALEKGRIRNPSIATLEALAKGFGMTVSDLFRRAEFDQRDYFSLGSPKGLYKIDLPSQGIQLISFTPLMEELFCGKMILEGQRRFDEKLFDRDGAGAFFIMILIGQFEGEIEGRRVAFFSTAPERQKEVLRTYLEDRWGCRVMAGAELR